MLNRVGLRGVLGQTTMSSSLDLRAPKVVEKVPDSAIVQTPQIGPTVTRQQLVADRLTLVAVLAHHVHVILVLMNAPVSQIDDLWTRDLSDHHHPGTDAIMPTVREGHDPRTGPIDVRRTRDLSELRHLGTGAIMPTVREGHGPRTAPIDVINPVRGFVPKARPIGNLHFVIRALRMVTLNEIDRARVATRPATTLIVVSRNQQMIFDRPIVAAIRGRRQAEHPLDTTDAMHRRALRDATINHVLTSTAPEVLGALQIDVRTLAHARTTVKNLAHAAIVEMTVDLHATFGRARRLVDEMIRERRRVDLNAN